jgi:hypothetical protein
MAALLAGVLTASPSYPDPFWARDMNGLVERLAEAPDTADGEEQRQLFADLVRLLNCEPLPFLEPDERPAHASRTLLRLEQARRARLGADARTAPTLWRDVLRPDFFRRAAVLPRDQALHWPLEEERWSNESLEFRLKPSACEQAVPAGDELPLLTPERMKAWEGALGPELTARLRYHQATRLLRAGKTDEARTLALTLEPTRLGAELRPLAELLRVALGHAPATEYLRLAREPALEEQRLPIVVQAAALLARAGEWEQLLALSAPYARWPGPTTPPAELALRQDLFYRRVLAHLLLGQREALARDWADAFPTLAGAKGPVAEALRGLALTSLARGDLTPEALALLRDLGPAAGLGTRLATLGGLALDTGNARLALAVSERLLQETSAPARARGYTLRAEVALASDDPTALTRAIERLLDLRQRERASTRELGEMDRVVLALAQSLVTASADLPEARWRPVLTRQLEAMRQGVHSRHEPTFAPLLAALEDRAPQLTGKGKGQRLQAFVSVGQVSVGALTGMLSPPDFAVTWPEPYSLLVLPVTGAPARAWFPRDPLPPELSHAP